MKKILLLLFLLCSFTSSYAVYFNYDVDRIEEYYVTRISPDISMSSNSYFLNDKITGDFFYCIEPLLLLDQNIEYTRFDDYNPSINVSNEMFYKINLIAYYGYGYKDHVDIKWYTVTQYLIWKTLFPDYDIFFANGKFGDRINILTDEIVELTNLVSNDLNGLKYNSEYEVTTNIEYVLFESNYLNNYDIKTDLNYEIKENKFIINPSESGTYSVTFKRKIKKKPIIFFSHISQNIIRPGDFNYTFNFTVKVITKDLKVIKMDKETNELIENTLFGLYDTNDKLIETKRTNKMGEATFKNLSINKYYIKELESSYGYHKDAKLYEIDLNKSDEVYIYNKKITKEFVLKKLYQSDTIKAEIGAKFILYKDTKKIGEYETDSNGLINLNLEYGNYKLKQIEGIEGFYLADDYEFTIDDKYQDEEHIIINKPKENTSILTIEVPDTLK